MLGYVASLVRHNSIGISQLTSDLMVIYNDRGRVFCETCEDFAAKYGHQTPHLLLN
jgi:hypothetical protein